MAELVLASCKPTKSLFFAAVIATTKQKTDDYYALAVCVKSCLTVRLNAAEVPSVRQAKTGCIP